MGHLSNGSQLSISQDHYTGLNLCTEKTQRSQDSSSVTSLPNPAGSVFFSRSDQRAIASRFAGVFLDLQPRHWHRGI